MSNEATIETVNKRLPVELSQEEKDELGLKLADLNIEIETKIEIKKALPKQIEGLQERAAILGHELKTGTVEKDVECYWEINEPVEGKKQLYRTDTGEPVGEPVDMELFDSKEELPENPEEAEVSQ